MTNWVTNSHLFLPKSQHSTHHVIRAQVFVEWWINKRIKKGILALWNYFAFLLMFYNSTWILFQSIQFRWEDKINITIANKKKTLQWSPTDFAEALISGSAGKDPESHRFTLTTDWNSSDASCICKRGEDRRPTAAPNTGRTREWREPWLPGADSHAGTTWEPGPG